MIQDIDMKSYYKLCHQRLHSVLFQKSVEDILKDLQTTCLLITCVSSTVKKIYIEYQQLSFKTRFLWKHFIQENLFILINSSS